MRQLFTILIFFQLLISLPLMGQTWPGEGDIVANPNFDILQAPMTFGGSNVPAGSRAAVFEENGNIVGVSEILGSFLNVSIYADEDGRDQLSVGECFTMQIYHSGLMEYFDVAVEATDGRLCSMSSSREEPSKGGEISLNFKQQPAAPSIFGPFASSGQPLTGWEFTSPQLQALPVEYSSITLTNNKCQSVSFDWTTSSELGNEGFYVERKVQGERGWNTLGFVKGSGTTSREVNYSFEDDEIVENKSLRVVYYRLKQVDFNGRMEYSEVQSVRLNCGKETFINVFPNPVNDYTKITLNHEGLNNDNVTFEIYSINGQRILTFTEKINDQEAIEFNTSDFPTGLFRIQAITNDKIIAHTKFIKN